MARLARPRLSVRHRSAGGAHASHTVFLDEIGELPLEVQPKLLRVLQEREFERLGSARTLRTDARLIAATNRDLAALIDVQQFHADLFYRVNVFTVRQRAWGSNASPCNSVCASWGSPDPASNRWGSKKSPRKAAHTLPEEFS